MLSYIMHAIYDTRSHLSCDVISKYINYYLSNRIEVNTRLHTRVRVHVCASVVRAFAYSAMSRRIDLHGGPNGLFPQLV